MLVLDVMLLRLCILKRSTYFLGIGKDGTFCIYVFFFFSFFFLSLSLQRSIFRSLYWTSLILLHFENRPQDAHVVTYFYTVFFAAVSVPLALSVCVCVRACVRAFHYALYVYVY